MNRRAGQYFSHVGSCCGRIAADVAAGGVFDAAFALGVFGLARDGPVFGFGDAVDDEPREGVCQLWLVVRKTG